jgi:hypothetical protein
MIPDHSVYPEFASPPAELNTPEEKADYMQRICAAFDFGIFPEESDWHAFAGWKDIFDRYPIPDSPAYHTFRKWYGWNQIRPEKRLGLPSWKIADLREGRSDPCEGLI